MPCHQKCKHFNSEYVLHFFFVTIYSPFSVLRRYLEVKRENFEAEFFCIHKFRHTLNKITFNGGWNGGDKNEHILIQSSWSFQNSVTVNAFNILPFYITHESLWRPWFPHFSSFLVRKKSVVWNLYSPGRSENFCWVITEKKLLGGFFFYVFKFTKEMKKHFFFKFICEAKKSSTILTKLL